MTGGDGDVVERARRKAEQLATSDSRHHAEVVADETAPAAERARAFLAIAPHDRVWVIADTVGRASKWAKANDIERVIYVQAAANLHNLTAGSFVIVLPGAENHRDWRRITRQIKHLADTDRATVVTVDDDRLAGKPVGGIVFRDDTFTVEPMKTRQPDALLFYDHSPRAGLGRVLAELDRATVERLARALTAYLNSEPLPDPDAEEADRIRQLIAATGDPFGRGTSQ